MSKFNWGMRPCGVFLLWLAAAIALPAQTFTTLHSFDNGTDGESPEAGLVQGTDGKFYGTTELGGTNGYGTVFSITADGKLATLHSFHFTDGAAPFGELVRAANGQLYGTTAGGGASNACSGGCGTVFKITLGGTLTTLHSFDGTDGSSPYAGLIQATNGNFYGTTKGGGANNGGTIFRITAGGKLTIIHNFCLQGGQFCGWYPQAGLVQGSDGDFYGTTVFGGAGCESDYGYGCGTVFKITPNGRLTTLHSFCVGNGGCTDGSNPLAGLVQDTEGNFYGTTTSTVFKIAPSGTLTTLYRFPCSQQNVCPDGTYPSAALVLGTDGDLYGTTAYGGADLSGSCHSSGPGCGTIFKITPSGTLTTLYSFCAQTNCTDGAVPYAGLVRGTNGTFYGTTWAGGAGGYGTIFSLSVGLGSFVKTLPTLTRSEAQLTSLGRA
jgi:uncharacterized repeat protein (TIGR03803 family)